MSLEPHNPEDLLKIFNDAESADKPMFAEMRSNILLIAGEHFAKKNSKFHERIRNSRSISDEQKIRITKNHVQKIHKIYSNNITSYAPGVSCRPHNPKELKDQKSAELAQSIWAHIKAQNNFDEKISDWADEFTGIGECHTKVYWNPNAGEFKGFEQATDEDGNALFEGPDGEPTPDAISLHPQTSQIVQHEPLPSEKAVFTGALQYETLFGFNVMRAPEVNSFDESPYIVIRKMSTKNDMIALIPSDDPDAEEKKKWIEASTKEAFVVFDAQKGTYDQNSDLIQVLEFYFRPSVRYPKGYFFIATSQCEKLFEGELPFGVFPIVSSPFEKAPTLPRGISPVRTMRPYQIEINRAASKIAEHQITLGDDKVITATGTKISQGANLPGIRQLIVQGPPPTLLEGRSGEQFAASMTATIEELYSVMMCKEMEIETNGQLDPYAMLFRSASQKQKFNRNTKRFENFLKKICEVSLDLARNYFQGDELVTAVGKSEMVNISEFKNQHKLAFMIEVEPQSEDIESKLGRQLSLNHLLQYAASKLGKEDIGMIYRDMPYGNDEEMSRELTLDYDNAVNMILALDRGEQVEANMYDQKEYMVRKLVNRMREADFRQLPPQIQQNYTQAKQQFEQMIALQAQQIQAQQADFIPTDGPLTVIDFYVADPQDPNKTRRARLPYNSIQWLIKRLEDQGSSLQQLEQLPQGAMADVAQMHSSQNPQVQMGPAGAQAPLTAKLGRPPGNGMPMGNPGLAHRNAPQPGPMPGGVSNVGTGSGLNTFNPNLIGAATSPG